MGGQPLPTGSVDMTVTLKATGGGPDAVANTTIGVVATNAALTKPEAHRVCIMAQGWFRPGDQAGAHARSTATRCSAWPRGRGRHPATTASGWPTWAPSPPIAWPVRSARGIFEAADLGGIASYRTQHGHALGRS